MIAAFSLSVWGDKFDLDESQLQPPIYDKRKANCNILAVSGARISDFAGCSLVRSTHRQTMGHSELSERSDR